MKSTFKVFVILLLIFSGSTIKATEKINLVKTNNEIANKLAKHADFKYYVVNITKLYNSIIETKSQSLFLKFIKNDASETELQKLASDLNYHSITDLKKFITTSINKLENSCVAIKGFIELNGSEKKDVFGNAIKLFANSSNMKTARKLYPTSYCWYLWTIDMALCAIYFPEGGQSYWECVALADLAFSVCWIGSED